MFKKILIHTRRSMKIFILLAIAGFVIAGILIFLYQTTYSVKINGVEIGYTKNKSELQERINEYIESGDRNR